MTYFELFGRLCKQYASGEAQAILRSVMETRFRLSFADILSGGIGQLSDGDTAELETIMQRLEKGEPVQYVLGETEFCGRRFSVEPGVLIPRPETEGLCEWVVETVRRNAGNKHADGLETGTGSNGIGSHDGIDILDIGTGSGCIAITLALDIPDARVTAWDISDEALRIARSNAEMLGAGVDFVRQDALNPPADSGKWDVIVSNPPYVCMVEIDDMERHVVDYEPGQALYVPDNNPLLFYRAIAGYAAAALKPGGSLFFETNTIYTEATAAMMRDMGYHRVETGDDCFFKPRFAKGKL